MKDFDSFQTEWLGRSIDFDHVYAYQCVDLILQYIYECYGINGAYGNAIDYWNTPDAKLLTKFYKWQGNDIQKGDIAIFHGLPGNPYGHIGIATGNTTANQLEILEQNGATGNGSGTDGNAIRTRYIDRSRLAGLLRPMVTSAPAAPPPPPAPRYQVTESYTPAKQIKLNQQPTYLWGMNYDFATMVKNPVETHNQGEICEVTNKVHHEDGSNYYRRDGQVDGFNVVDCDDYTPPPPPAAPVPFTASEKYQLDWAVPRYAIAADAMNKQNVVDTLSPSNGYFVYSRDLGMVNVTDDNQKNKQWWINPAQNVPPVPVAVPQPVVAQTTPIQVTTVPAPLTSVLRNPADWRTTLSAYNLLREPERFISINTTTIDIQDLEGKHEPIQLLPHTKVDAIATFEKDGILYARPQACFLPDNKYFGSWYGIPTRVLKADAIYNRAGAILDRLSLGNSRFGDRLISDFVRVRQTIDGILAKRKVK
jgi:hypothetical protein